MINVICGFLWKFLRVFSPWKDTNKDHSGFNLNLSGYVLLIHPKINFNFNKDTAADDQRRNSKDGFVKNV